MLRQSNASKLEQMIAGGFWSREANEALFAIELNPVLYLYLVLRSAC